MPPLKESQVYLVKQINSEDMLHETTTGCPQLNEDLTSEDSYLSKCISTENTRSILQFFGLGVTMTLTS